MPAPDYQRELAAYDRMRDQLLPALDGKWAVIHQDGIVGLFDTYAAASKFGHEHYHPRDFMMIEISPPAGPFDDLEGAVIIRDDDEEPHDRTGRVCSRKPAGRPGGGGGSRRPVRA